MPDYTVSGDVDSMLRSANDAAIRSAIGVGTTDAPTLGGITIGTGNAKLQYTPGGSLTLSRVSDGGVIFVANPDSNDLAIGAITTDRIRNRFTGANGANLELLGNGVLEQRNGTTAQAFRVYNTFPGTGNNEWGGFDWITTTNTLRIGTALSGTGVGRGVILAASGTGTTKVFGGGGSTISVQLMTGGGGSSLLDVSSGSADLTSNANLKFGTDNTYDIGASGANRPRDLHVAGQFYLGGVVRTSGGIKWNVGGTVFIESSNGVVSLQSSSGNDFGRLQLGGTTDAFPAIARDGAGIKITGAASGLTSWIKVPAVAVASLPLAATAGVGARSFVNDALSPVFGSAVTGGGAVIVPVYSTGSAWNVG